MGYTTKRRIVINDNHMMVYMTCLFVEFGIMGLLTNNAELAIITMIFFNVYASQQIFNANEKIQYGCVKISAICCISYNIAFVTVILIIETASGYKSSIRTILLCLIFAGISIGGGYITWKAESRHKKYYSYYENYRRYIYKTDRRQHENYSFFERCTTTEEIRKRYRSLSKHYHPDNKKTGDEEIFKIINEQYEILRDMMT